MQFLPLTGTSTMLFIVCSALLGSRTRPAVELQYPSTYFINESDAQCSLL